MPSMMRTMAAPSRGVSKRNNVSKQPRDGSQSGILAKNAVAIYTCPKDLPEAILKEFWTNVIGRRGFKTP